MAGKPGRSGRPATRAIIGADLLLKHGPCSPNTLVDITGIGRAGIDKYLKLAHEAGLVHILRFDPSPYVGRGDVKVWAYGPGEDAKRTYATQKCAKRKKRKSISKKVPVAPLKSPANSPKEIGIRRDPLVEAFFGAYAECT